MDESLVLVTIFTLPVVIGAMVVYLVARAIGRRR